MLHELGVIAFKTGQFEQVTPHPTHPTHLTPTPRALFLSVKGTGHVW